MSIPLLFIMSITSPSLPLIDPTLTLPMVNLLSSSPVANFSPPTSFASDGAPLFRDPRICGTRGRVVCSILLCIHGVLALFTTVCHYCRQPPLSWRDPLYVVFYAMPRQQREYSLIPSPQGEKVKSKRSQHCYPK